MKLIKQLPLLTALVAISFTAKAQQPDSLDVMLQGASAEEMASLVIHEGGTVTHQLPIINAIGATLSGQQMAAVLNTGRVIRHIDDLALNDQPQEPQTQPSDCRISGAVEISRRQNGFVWPLFNKTDKAQKLTALKLNWPAALGAIKLIQLGEHELPVSVRLQPIQDQMT